MAIIIIMQMIQHIQVQHFPAKQIKIVLKQNLLTKWILYTHLCNVVLTWKVFADM